MSPNHTRSSSSSKGSPIAFRPQIPSTERAAVLKLAAPPLPSISVLDAICRLIIAQDDGDRRAVEHYRDELSRDFGWVVRPPALPPDWRRR